MARSYNQDCILAYALDSLGERWTMLIVRELLLGPRRFADLTAALPGLGTNLLSKRLKELEGQNIIETDTSQNSRGIYRLTDAGENLRSTVHALMIWSVDYFLSYPGAREERARIYSNNLDPDAVALATEVFSISTKPVDFDYVAHMTIENEKYTLFYMEQKLIVRRGNDTPALAHVQISTSTAMQALRGEITSEELRENIETTGRDNIIQHIANLFTSKSDMLKLKKYKEHSPS